MSKRKEKEESRETAVSEAKKGAPRVPVLLEAALTVSRILILLAGISTGVSAWMAGCDPLTVALRAGGALLVAGLLVWMANWFLAQRSLAVLQAQMEAAGAHKNAESTITREA